MKEIRSLTGLRGIAALIVFWAHTHDTLDVRGLTLHFPVLVERLFMSGGRQVDIFFVLSGFILAMIYQSEFAKTISVTSYLTFMRRRLARIYPLHAFMVLLVLGFVLVAISAKIPLRHGAERFEFATLPQHFLLVHAWGPFIASGPGTWNPPSWSISIEFMAYLLFPGLIWVNARCADSRSWLIIVLVVVAGFALNELVPWSTDGFGGVARGLSEFSLGALTMNLYRSRLAAWLQSGPGSTLALAVVVITFAVVADTGFFIGAATAPFLLSLCGRNWPAQVFGSRPMHFLGEISYSIYLGHFLFTSLAYRIVSVEWMKGGMLQAMAGITSIFAIVLLLATLTYYTVERPGRAMFAGRRPAR